MPFCLPLLINACSHGVLWLVRSESQSSQTHFPPPLGLLFTHIRGSSRGAALRSQLPAMHEEGPVCSVTVLVAKQLSHQPTSTLLGCLLETANTVFGPYHTFLCIHTRPRNIASLTNSQCQELSRNAGKQGPTYILCMSFCTSPIPSLAGAAGALWVQPAMGSTES